MGSARRVAVVRFGLDEPSNTRAGSLPGYIVISVRHRASTLCLVFVAVLGCSSGADREGRANGSGGRGRPLGSDHTAVIHVTISSSGGEKLRRMIETTLVRRLQESGAFRRCVVGEGRGEADVLLRADIAYFKASQAFQLQCSLDLMLMNLRKPAPVCYAQVFGDTGMRLHRDWQDVAEAVAKETIEMVPLMYKWEGY
jgi:hypothetical protein